MYQVEVEAGRAEPVPDYAHEWPLARWMGVTLAELQAMNAGDVAKARIVMEATHRAQHEANRKAGQR